MKMALFECIIAIALFSLCVQSIGTMDVVSSVLNTCFITAAFSMVLLTWDLLHKLMYLVCHYSELCSSNISLRYTVSELFDTSISSMIYGIACIVLCMVFVALNRGATLAHLWSFGPQCSLIALLLAWHLFKMNWCRRIRHSAVSLLPILESKGLDYGTGMAFSYYYGYLRIILPCTGTSVKGFLEKLENLEDAHNIRFAIRKMLILIPASGYIPPNLKEASHEWMESAINFEEEKRDRAGIKARSYKNTVYKIHPGGRGSGFDPVYVAVEGATPLLTFYEVQKHLHAESLLYREHSTQILQNFYKKLKELINNDPKCRDICELIYYDDYTEEGRVNVAQVILQRISEMTNILHNHRS